jgi:hypothetical protein
VPDKVTPLKVAIPADAVLLNDPLDVTPSVPPVPLAMATETTVLLSVVTRLPC